MLETETVTSMSFDAEPDISSFVADRYADLGNCSWFEAPAFECLDGEFVEDGAARALEHPCVGDPPGRGINADEANAATG